MQIQRWLLASNRHWFEAIYSSPFLASTKKFKAQLDRFEIITSLKNIIQYAKLVKSDAFQMAKDDLLSFEM